MKSLEAYQPTIPGAEWGSVFDVERKMSTQADFFLHLKTGEELKAIIPIKYSLETHINTYLGIIACLSGHIDRDDFLESIQGIDANSRSSISDEAACKRHAEVVLAGNLTHAQGYRRSLMTYQGDIDFDYHDGETYFTITNEYEEGTGGLALALPMILRLSEVVSSPCAGVSESYFATSRKIAETIAHLWQGERL